MKRENKQEQKSNRNLFRHIKGILVIQARHISRRHGKLQLVGKSYYWRADNKTHHLKYASPGHLAVVQDKGSKHAVQIVKNWHPTVPGAIAMAKHLNYVYNFYDRTLRNGRVVPD